MINSRIAFLIDISSIANSYDFKVQALISVYLINFENSFPFLNSPAIVKLNF